MGGIKWLELQPCGDVVWPVRTRKLVTTTQEGPNAQNPSLSDRGVRDRRSRLDRSRQRDDRWYGVGHPGRHRRHLRRRRRRLRLPPSLLQQPPGMLVAAGGLLPAVPPLSPLVTVY